jgi:hypothetical protein
LSIVEPDARSAYLEAFRRPAAIHAVCEDYRAGATVGSPARHCGPRRRPPALDAETKELPPLRGTVAGRG